MSAPVISCEWLHLSLSSIRVLVIIGGVATKHVCNSPKERQHLSGLLVVGRITILKLLCGVKTVHLTQVFSESAATYVAVTHSAFELIRLVINLAFVSLMKSVEVICGKSLVVDV